MTRRTRASAQQSDGGQRPAALGPGPLEPGTSAAGSAESRRPGSGARWLAYRALIAVEERPVFLKTVLDELAARRSISSSDRALALEIAAGVTRRRMTVDAVLGQHVRRPASAIEPGLWTLLRIGTYQLLFLEMPPHAAVHETVELARRLRQRRWTTFLNGVLRGVQRDITAETATGPSEDALPLCTLAPPISADSSPPAGAELAARSGDNWRDSGVRVEYRRLASMRFPSPHDRFAEYVAVAFSLPPWLVQRWELRHGSDETLRLAAWFATPGRVSLRVNLIRTTRDELLERLRAQGLAAVAGGPAASIRLLENVRIDRLPGFAEGLFSIQDESAVAGVELLDPRPGERVLDLCAAPGGKTTAMAERMQDRGQIVAADIDAKRVERIARGAARLGLSCIHPQVVRADGADLPAGPFDRVLLDVPCSNTGVLGKRPEARWRISAAGIEELARRQAALLYSALDRLAAGGCLVYSTCSIEPEENEQLVCSVLAGRPDVELVRELHHRPGLPGDGAYQALLAHPPGGW